MYDEHNPKIINFNAEYGDETLELQFVGQQKLLHGAICKYLERTLINLERAFKPSILQSALNAKVSQQDEFKGLRFCSDQRIYELMLGESVWGVIKRIKARDVDVRLLWQSANQPDCIRKFTNSASGSMDGAIGIFSPDIKGGVVVLPIEAKSTMLNPFVAPVDSLEEQVAQIINRKRDDFSKGPQINAVFVLPNSSDKELKIDLQPAANQLQDIMTRDSFGAICLLSIHENGLRLTTCVLYGKTYKLVPVKIEDFMGITHYIFPSMED